MTSLPQLCIVIAVLLLFSALFSASETALTSVSRVRMTAFAEKYPVLLRYVNWVQKQRYQVLSTILIANNLVNIAASAVGTALTTRLFPRGGVLYAVFVMTVLIVIFGEILPKSIAMVKGESLLFVVLPSIWLTNILLSPFVWLMVKIVAVVGRFLGIDLSIQNSFVTREEIEQVVKIGEASGAIVESERRMIHGVISFEETRVSEIMVPRTDVHALDVTQTIDDVLAFERRHGHSRIPVCKDTLDDIVGILYIKDMLPLIEEHTRQSIASLMRKPLFVPETMKIPDLFKMMKMRRIHMAVVVDEYGGTAGIITLEDLLEEIVGEIRDEYDTGEPEIIKLGDSRWKVQGSMPLEDLNEAIGSDFQSDEVDSVGGYALNLSGNFPQKGEKIHTGPWTFEVTEVGDHRVVTLIISRDTREEDNGKKE